MCAGAGKTALQYTFSYIRVCASLTDLNEIFFKKKMNCKFVAFFLAICPAHSLTSREKKRQNKRKTIDEKYALINFHPIFLSCCSV